jgi:MinD superfamily P-loop ATPase
VQPEEPVVASELEMAVAQITDFGFTDIDKIVKILKEVNGDTSAAIDRLLEDA